MALALASTPSHKSPEDAPVTTAILNSLPSECSFSAFAAMADGIAFVAPAGVNPLNAICCPF